MSSPDGETPWESARVGRSPSGIQPQFMFLLVDTSLLDLSILPGEIQGHADAISSSVLSIKRERAPPEVALTTKASNLVSANYYSDWTVLDHRYRHVPLLLSYYDYSMLCQIGMHNSTYHKYY